LILIIFNYNPSIFRIQLKFFSLIISLLIWHFNNFILYSILFCLIYISGVIVLFIYISSFTPNIKKNVIHKIIPIFLIAININFSSINIRLNIIRSLNINIIYFNIIFMLILIIYLYFLFKIISINLYPIYLYKTFSIIHYSF